ncbi:MAG TPA: DUF1223 domain-containing protein [Ohtaekwangia sp.]|uniref:DUF1223 domain-containing protein n=1 Tax=Ohtaekwangia sp. TaxID=2066019 RepID=UPI002F94F9F9
MKSIRIFAAAAGICIVLIAAISIREEKTEDVTITTGNPGFALLELFTSEGCSSCPPADKLLEEIRENFQNQPVYILAFHVDYWNHLGWKDQFSKAEFTQRQRQYSRWLGVGSLYTPQLVINGSKEFVGSDRKAVLEEVTANLTTAKSNTLTLHCTIEGNKALVTYEGVARDERSELVLALVQKAAQSNVKAGENSGRKLSHVQIVKSLEHVRIDPSQPVTLTLPPDFTTADWELIGFVQQKSDGHASMAGRFDFDSKR